MRRLTRAVNSEEVVADTLHNIRQRYQRSVTGNETNLSNFQRLSIFHRYASYEMLAHWLAYELPNEFHLGYTLCKVLDDDGIARYYHPIKLLTKNPGLVCFILIPHDERTNKNSRVHVSFVGTLNWEGFIRDLEYCGAGHESFVLEREGILQQINDMVATVYARTKQKIRLTISGHSLGGSDAQNCAAAVIKAMAHNIDDQRFGYLYEDNEKFPKRVRQDLSNIASINIAHLNSAGVAQITADECSYDAKILKAGSEIELNMHVLRVKNDLLQFTGQARIFADINPRIVTVDILNFALREVMHYSPLSMLKLLTHILTGALNSVNQLGAALQAHSSIHFADSGEDEIVEYYNNQCPQGREKVKAYLSERSYADNSAPMFVAKMLLRGACIWWVQKKIIFQKN
jgi:hypothetical protein